MSRAGVDVCGECAAPVGGVTCWPCGVVHPVAASWRVRMLRFDHRRGA
jgi:hypothetical protein